MKTSTRTIPTVPNEYHVRIACADILGSSWKSATEERKDVIVRALLGLVAEHGGDSRMLRYGWCQTKPGVQLHGWFLAPSTFLTHARMPRVAKAKGGAS